MSWMTFIKAHWDVLAAIDFTTVEAWTRGALVTFYLLFVMELKTRAAGRRPAVLLPASRLTCAAERLAHFHQVVTAP